MTSVPDLLHPDARLRLDAPALRETLTFAFATGGGSEPFDKILESLETSPSPFNPECFAKDLFLSEFILRCFPIHIAGERYRLGRAFLRVLSRPAIDPKLIAFRHEILSELARDERLRDAAEQTFACILKLRRLLEAGERKHWYPIQRRIEVLRAARRVLELFGTEFEGAQSGLSRLHAFGQAIRQSKAYRDLCDLLDYEENLATVDLRVRVGYDGELRGFEIVRTIENTRNKFYLSPLGRFFARIRLLFRGYRFREAEILGRLADSVFDGIQEYVLWCFQLFGDFEFYFAGLAFKKFAESKGLAVCLPELRLISAERPTDTQLTRLFNPFLLLEERPPHPCDVTIRERALVVVTGPNSGGKTRLLQALGLMQLLAQAGLFVPAAEARLAIREGMFVSLLQEATPDQREGRLGTELLRIRRMFERLSMQSLVILDELCSGTNPSEGEEIFRLVIALLSDLEPQAFITTHFLQLAARLHHERTLSELAFLQVELDPHQHPTFAFIPGVAETSLARQTAERLGVTREALQLLVDNARREQADRLGVRPIEGPTSSHVSDRPALLALPRDGKDPNQGRRRAQ